ncbi:nucleotidyltransferase domain-containing protein [Altererythrobacter lutimaris]|uniref:Nucleotidyltransferase family protein n=1 Tax=Altererythrobacter lutimaris TaxID=2743979 RepID=A0A850H981_9SPHN|nr:nucleotidyltransferase family protein [Altererythrobacter lutimaris]NVE95717.1 nucleotidyltransferase family protein [Altererythrobacter lutimaris]
MADALPAAYAAILGICADPEGNHENLLSRLPLDQWQMMRDLAIRSRVAPLVVQTLDRWKAVPKDAAEPIADLREQARFHALAALQTASDVGHVLSVLAEDGLEPIVLKGTPLAFQIYPDPALRPLRDIDLLLSAEETLAAQALLLAHSDFERVPGVAQYGVEHSHQLPEIRYRKSGLVIELHHRLNARGWPQEPELVQAMRTNAEVTSVLGQEVRVPSRQDNFLHLLEHATLHHLFANGPLVLADLHYLTSASEWDWDAIMERVDALALTRSLELVCALASEHGATWVPAALLGKNTVPKSHCAAARDAMLASEDDTQQQAMLGRLAERSDGRMGWSAAFSRVFQPDAAQLSMLSGHPKSSVFRWLGYPKWLWRKAKLFADAKASDASRKAATDRLALSRWLEGA